jgi:VanZ family protein
MSVDTSMWIYVRTVAWLTIALSFWIANVVLHLDFSNWLTVQYQTSSGVVMPLNYKTEATVSTLIILVSLLCWQGYKGTNQKLTLMYWSIWIFISYAIMSFLITTNVELIHFLQYGALYYLLAIAIDSNRATWPLVTLMLITLAFGIVDELNQYFFLTPSNSVHMDFNDFMLNLQGAAGGMLFFYGFKLPNHQRKSRPGRLLTSVICFYAMCAIATVIFMWKGTLVYMPDHSVPPGGVEYAGDSIRVYLQREPNLLGNWNTSFSGGQYYIMSALEGISLLIIMICFYGGYGYLSQQLKPKP